MLRDGMAIDGYLPESGIAVHAEYGLVSSEGDESLSVDLSRSSDQIAPLS
jgi:hypothetical protein